jgi:hypothetical protein
MIIVFVHFEAHSDEFVQLVQKVYLFLRDWDTQRPLVAFLFDLQPHPSIVEFQLVH